MNILKVRRNQGYQAIRDIRKANIHPMHRGLPAVDGTKCPEGCGICAGVCPAQAISGNPPAIDLGRCAFCGDCVSACPAGAFEFTPYYKLSSRSREGLVVCGSEDGEAYRKRVMERASREIRRLFGRSFKMREVSAGGCNGCEMELNACSNVNFDMGRFGIEVVASPRHADCILLTGPLSENMADAFRDAWEATPDPKLLVLAGACAISGGVFRREGALDRSFLDSLAPDLYIPGCPVHPLTVVNGLLDLLTK